MGVLKGKTGWRSSTSDNKGNVINNLTVGLQAHGGVVFGCGTSASPKTSSTASAKFSSRYFENSATSGTAVGDYVRLKITGIAGSGVASRYYAYTNVASALIVGAQITGETGAAGTVSGLMLGCRSQVIIADDATSAPTGTIAGGQSELYFNGDNSSTTDITGSRHSIHRFILDGDTTARAKCVNAFEFVNIPAGTGDEMFTTKYLTASHGIRIMVNNASYYMLCDAV